MKERPQTWHYQDPIKHRLHKWSMRARAQALFRGEAWDLTDDEYIEIWLTDNRYLNRGRSNSNLCMTRRDHELPWSKDNIDIIERGHHYRTCNGFKGIQRAVAEGRHGRRRSVKQ